MIFLRFFWEEKVLEIWVVPNGELQVFTASFLFGFHVWACLFHLWSTMPGSGLCVTPHHHLPWCRNSIVPSQMELTFQKEFTGATFLTASLWYWGHLLWQLLPPTLSLSYGAATCHVDKPSHLRYEHHCWDGSTCCCHLTDGI